MRKINELTPFVGDALNYLYDGSVYEGLRVCNVYSFHLFTDGPGEIEINGKIYPIDRRTLVFIRPGEPHAFHIFKKKPLTSLNIYCDLWDCSAPVSLARSFIYAPEPFEFKRKTAVENCEELDCLPSVFSLRPYPWLYESFVTLITLFNESKYYRSEIVNHLLCSCLLGWFNLVNSKQPSDYRIVKLLSHINEWPEERSSIDEWSTRCGLKRSYFHALFLRETGMTPKAYQHKILMRRAANLLKETELSVTAISEKLGYSSIHPFTRHFSDTYGISPRQFRTNSS